MQNLISAGHNPDSIGKYTLAQVKRFSEEISAIERHRIRSDMIAIRTAQHAKNRVFKKAIKELE